VAATGTRGAWLATAALLVIAGLWAIWRRLSTPRESRGGRERRTLWIAAGLGVVSVVGAALVAGPEVVGRAGRGVEEIRRVMDEGDFSTDTGRRLFMWIESWRALAAHPLGGLGAGGLNAWAESAAATRGLDPALVLPHAHGMWVHLGATQGLVGVGLWAAVLGAAVASGVAPRPRSGHAPGAAALSRAYSLSPVLALVGLALAGVFDTVHVNSQTAMLLFALVALCAMGRAEHEPVAGGPEPREEQRRDRRE
jgi:O-antigen ligase